MRTQIINKYNFLFFVFLFVNCSEEIDNQFTIVKGTVSNFLTQEPVANFPVVFRNSEAFCFFDCEDPILDTIFTDENGNYYLEFYSNTKRAYRIIADMMNENYYLKQYYYLFDGENNTCNFALKPLTVLSIECIKSDSLYNGIRIYHRLLVSSLKSKLTGHDTIFKTKIIPDFENHLTIDLSHKNIEGKYDGSKRENLEFYASKNDTTFTFYY